MNKRTEAIERVYDLILRDAEEEALYAARAIVEISKVKDAGAPRPRVSGH